jgi:NitT/TauT family transport system ATP-binding protein
VPAIAVRNVWKSFQHRRGEVLALRDLSLTVDPGELVCVIGPSGCGKTTLLRLMDGLLQPDRGDVLIDGVGEARPGPHAAMVFQSFRLLPWRTVLGNVELPIELHGSAAHDRRELAREQLRLVGLQEFANSYPRELSGGMQQRVGLARALVSQPRILLMDEPFAALDAQTREFMQVELSRIWAATGVAIVFVTHSLDEALFLGDRVVLLSARPGGVAEVLSVPFSRPRWQYDAHGTPEYADLRAHLWQRIKAMVAEQPEFREAVLTP